MKPYYGWLVIGLGVGIILLAIGQCTLWHRISKLAPAATIIPLSSPSNAPFADPTFPDGNGPYTPTKLEWLAMELNGHAHRYSMGSDGFLVNCQARGSNTINIEVLYYEDMTNNIAKIRRETAMESVKAGLKLRCQAHGWDWVNTSEEYTKWPFELAGLPVGLLPYVPTRFEWSQLTAKFDESKYDKYPGLKPYAPTRLEWLAVELNAMYRSDDLRTDNFTIGFIPSKDTLMILVQYIDNVDRMAMSRAVETARKIVEKNRDREEWPWLQIKEEYKLLKAHPAGD